MSRKGRAGRKAAEQVTLVQYLVRRERQLSQEVDMLNGLIARVTMELQVIAGMRKKLKK